MGNFPDVPGYKILKELGKGGMARVYLAYEEKLEREVALKVLLRSLTEEEEIRKRFLKEAKTAARLRHSNIVSIYDVGQLRDIYYFSMEHLEGSMKERITSDNESLQPIDAFRITKQLAGALGYAHNEGYIHRDIKPGNILFRKDGTAVMVDFGIAKAVDSATKTSKTWMSAGTPYYMSPEQINGEDLDHKTDIYSLGVVLYEMLTGRVPYDGPNFISISMKHIQDPVPKLPKPLSRCQPLIDKTMAKKKDDRVRDGKALIELLDKYLREEEAKKESQGSTQIESGSMERKRRLVPLFATFVFLALSVLAIYFLILKPVGKTALVPEDTKKDEPVIEKKTGNPPLTSESNLPTFDLKNLTRVRMPMCIRKVEPVYPSAAVEAHVQGKVLIDAVTDINGNVVETAVVSGNPLLTEAAVEAVKKWKYKPYSVNNKPIPVVFSVTLDFRLELSENTSESPDKDVEK